MEELEYHESVKQTELGLAPYAKRSIEACSPTFMGGVDVFTHFTKEWQGNNRLKYKHRTPIQLERDRVLYSHGMRKQTEKHHVLYSGQRRIVRAYATHTMKMAQVARAICRGLNLNQDFAEAIALGAKIGSVPFIHASKQVIGKWAEDKLTKNDKSLAPTNPISSGDKSQLSLTFDSSPMPGFVSRLESSTVLDKVQKYMPWAAGHDDAKLYGSGQESYWLLCTNPFTNRGLKTAFSPETMYGVWRHTRGLRPGQNRFFHHCKLAETKNGFFEISDKNATFEAIIVQYADDITWAIENLNDANTVSVLNGKTSAYSNFRREFESDDPFLSRTITDFNSGDMYNYFISDFIKTSENMLSAYKQEALARASLGEGNKNVMIGLSVEAEDVLEKIIKFLNEQIFTEPRTANRTEMLKNISSACIELIHNSSDVLPNTIKDQAALSNWNAETQKLATNLLDDPVHKIQLSMDVLSSWGDQEIYDFVGIQSL